MFNGKDVEFYVKVKNTPDYGEKRRYVVATLENGILWFYGATDSPEKALEMERESPQRLTLERVEHER